MMEIGWPDETIRYFDEDFYEGDALFSCTVLGALGGEVFVFVNL